MFHRFVPIPMAVNGDTGIRYSLCILLYSSSHLRPDLYIFFLHLNKRCTQRCYVKDLHVIKLVKVIQTNHQTPWNPPHTMAITDDEQINQSYVNI